MTFLLVFGNYQRDILGKYHPHLVSCSGLAVAMFDQSGDVTHTALVDSHSPLLIQNGYDREKLASDSSVSELDF